MSFTDDEITAGSAGGDAEPRDPAQTLDEITRLLHRMLALAELSASELPVDRELLQKTLDQLKNKVDRLADSM